MKREIIATQFNKRLQSQMSKTMHLINKRITRVYFRGANELGSKFRNVGQNYFKATAPVPALKTNMNNFIVLVASDHSGRPS